MSEEAKQGEQENQETKEQEINLDDYVPKSEYESKIKDSEKSLESLKSELEQAKLQLLDPEYLKWREDKGRKGSKKETPEGRKTEEPQSLEEFEALKEEIQKTQDVLRELIAVQELDATKKRYPDFDEYREDIAKILEQSNMTYEQAYFVAKQHKTEISESGDKTPTKKPQSTEKPTSTVPAKTLEKKDFKTREEADKATVAALREKYPDLGDTI